MAGAAADLVLLLVVLTAVAAAAALPAWESLGNHGRPSGKNSADPTLAKHRTEEDLFPSGAPTTSHSPTCPAACGRVEVKDGMRIVGGVEAAAHSHPWVGGLVMGGETRVWCGAALITDLYLLTAAHCAKRIFPEEGSVEVVLGSSHVVKGSGGVQQRIVVAEVIMHEGHDPLTLAHDLALLRLATPADVGSEVRPICLPEPTVNYTGTMATTAGWGRLSEGGEVSGSLQEVRVPVLSMTECGALYPDAAITSDLVCAGAMGKDACQADSGGPLVVEEDGRRFLLGITSWGRGCGRPHSPGVYVRVASYLRWVAEQVKEDPCGYLSSLPRPAATTPAPTQSCSCGLANPGERVVGGWSTSPQQYPWQVALVGYYQIRPFCGGALLADAWVLTAAHCAAEMHHDDQVLLGEHQWNSAIDTTVMIRRNVAQIIVHPDFGKFHMDGDLALLRLAKPLNLGQLQNRIAPVCLPWAGQVFQNTTGIVTGWGTTTYGGLMSTILRAVQVSIWGQEECEERYGAALTRNMLCAGEAQGGKDACEGDSGGPLMTEVGGGRYVLAGLVSWGFRCALPNSPGVYVRVANYLPWINEHINSSETCGGIIGSTIE